MSKDFTSFLDKNKTLAPILEAIVEAGGVPYLVGGSVRDMLLGFSPKDIDIEVHGITLDVLETCLKKFGPVRLVGKQFGVLLIDGIDVDWSIPRKDSKGRKPTVELDPNMSIEEASRRRDLTINAMAINLAPLEKKAVLVDPYGGEDDLKNKTLRAVDEKLFCEDPLRFYRVMQFISRFETHPDESLTKICKTIDINGVAKERVFDELKKMLLKSKRPSLGIRWLKKIGRLKEIMPELHALIEVKQQKKHHPEGDVFEHTMQALDASAVLTYLHDEEKLLIMLAVLCHDFGKAITIDAELRNIGHEKEGVPLAISFLKRFSKDSFLQKALGKLVRYHLAPVDFLRREQGEFVPIAKLSAYKRLAGKLAPEVNLRQLGLVALSDKRGRNPKGPWPLEDYQELLEAYMQKVQEAEVEHGALEPVLKGRHIIDVVSPGEAMGDLLDQAYEIQIEEGVTDIETLKTRVLRSYKREKD